MHEQPTRSINRSRVRGDVDEWFTLARSRLQLLPFVRLVLTRPRDLEQGISRAGCARSFRSA